MLLFPRFRTRPSIPAACITFHAVRNAISSICTKTAEFYGSMDFFQILVHSLLGCRKDTFQFLSHLRYGNPPSHLKDSPGPVFLYPGSALPYLDVLLIQAVFQFCYLAVLLSQALLKAFRLDIFFIQPALQPFYLNVLVIHTVYKAGVGLLQPFQLL